LPLQVGGSVQATWDVDGIQQTRFYDFRLLEEKKIERSKAVHNVLSCCHQMFRSIWFHYFHSKTFNSLPPSSIVRPNLFDSFSFIKNKFWPEQKAKISFPWFKFGK
jgi:hypothetical protein